MKIIPSLDLMSGKLVRLTKGKQESAKFYDMNPVDYARECASFNVKHIHIVDLDAAFGNDNTLNKKVIEDIVKNVSGLKVDVGGGIRTKQQIQSYLELGVDKVCLGTISVTDKETIDDILDTFGSEKFILCPDVNDTMVVTHGWQNTSDMSIFDYIREYSEKYDIKDYICTDVNRDGMLSGPSLDLYVKLVLQFPEINLIASGGVSSRNDVHVLNDIRLSSVIIGKALLENKIDWLDLIKYLKW